MSLSRDSRQKRKLKAFRRGQFAIKQRCERIDWEIDTLNPELDKIDAGASVLGLEAGAVFDIEIRLEADDAIHLKK